MMHHYLKQIKQNSNTLATISTPVEDEDMIFFTLNGLPADYNIFKKAVRNHSQAITMSELQELLVSLCDSID